MPIIYPKIGINYDHYNALALNKRLLERMVVLPEYRLLFCLIEKNANTAFGKIFSHIKRDNRYAIMKKQPSTAKEHNLYNYNLTVNDMSILIKNTSWTKAVFYREPLSRFLSAYRSKCEKFDPDGGRWCGKGLHMKTTEATFDKAVSYLYNSQMTIDAHFTPQVEFCGGLQSSLQYYQHVYELSSLHVRQDFTSILQTVQLPHKHSMSNTSSHMCPLHNNLFLATFDTLLPAPKGSSEDGREFLPERVTHFREKTKGNTFSSNTQTLLQYYSRQCYIRVVVDFYQADYDVFNISYPEWARAALANTSRESCRGLMY
jgi:hypothetical protein